MIPIVSGPGYPERSEARDYVFALRCWDMLINRVHEQQRRILQARAFDAMVGRVMARAFDRTVGVAMRESKAEESAIARLEREVEAEMFLVAVPAPVRSIPPFKPGSLAVAMAWAPLKARG